VDQVRRERRSVGAGGCRCMESGGSDIVVGLVVTSTVAALGVADGERWWRRSRAADDGSE
jgi:hypothetical protein